MFAHTVYALQDVSIRDSNNVIETIQCTTEHPFYVDGLGWTGSSHFIAGENLVEPGGVDATVVSSTLDARPGGVSVYNFEVDTDHTYFVAQGGDAVWVRNACSSTSGENTYAQIGRAEHDQFFANMKVKATR